MTLVGVVGDGADSVVEGIDEAGGDAVTGQDVDSVLASDPDLLLALGEPAFMSLAVTNPSGPILPVGAIRGFDPVPRTRLDSAIHDLLDGDFETTSTTLVEVTIGPETRFAAADVMLVTAEPAKISEYGIHEVTAGDRRTIDTVRADGVVVATPRGSHGYAGDAHGPILSPDADTVSVAPIAPFRIDHRVWGLAPPVQLTVERDESDVTLIVDGVQHDTLDTDTSVDVDWGPTITLARVDASQSTSR